ncbi:hypothetical protein Tco_0396499 [Tanacetum coccineum]
MEPLVAGWWQLTVIPFHATKELPMINKVRSRGGASGSRGRDGVDGSRGGAGGSRGVCLLGTRWDLEMERGGASRSKRKSMSSAGTQKRQGKKKVGTSGFGKRFELQDEPEQTQDEPQQTQHEPMQTQDEDQVDKTQEQILRRELTKLVANPKNINIFEVQPAITTPQSHRDLPSVTNPLTGRWKNKQPVKTEVQ